MLTAKEIMTAPVKTVPEEATLREVAELLSLQKISGAPVVDTSGKLVGVITESDLLNESKKTAALPRTAVFGFFLVPEETLRKVYHEGASLLARDVMTRDVVTAAEDTELDDLAQTMLDRKINRVPIVDGAGNMVGIVTREDVLRGRFGLKRP